MYEDYDDCDFESWAGEITEDELRAILIADDLHDAVEAGEEIEEVYLD